MPQTAQAHRRPQLERLGLLPASQRLGFTALEDDGVYLFMEWSPDR
jgi:hypothetical protein